MILQGDCLEKLKELEENSVDSIVTDPPYELGFMSKKWDNSGIAYNVDMWAECLRVLKPGGHLLSFSGTRTYHRMAVAIEDAGFEVRDMIEWIYASGFPKSLNIGKAVDKLQGNEREKTYKKHQGAIDNSGINEGWQRPWRDDPEKLEASKWATKGTSEWEGWGTALKPAHEPICMARKPLAEKTVAENCLKYGTGGINIDESRVGTNPGYKYRADANGTTFHGQQGERIKQTAEKKGSEFIESTLGRFPANLIHDNSEEVRECFPETGDNCIRKPITDRKKGYEDYAIATGGNSFQGMKALSKAGNYNDGSGNASRFFKSIPDDKKSMWFNHGEADGTGVPQGPTYNDTGNASRFFKSIIYQAKASKSERNAGCEGLEEKQYSHDGRDKEIENAFQRNKSVATNNHPTVKPIALMEYLIKMVTPKGGICLDPFMGSGSTGVACIQNGFDFIGIDMTPEYIEIAKARIAEAEREIGNKLL